MSPSHQNQIWKVFFLLPFSFFLLPFFFLLADENRKPRQIEIIDKHILPYMKRERVPGMAVALFFQDKRYIVCYGIANLSDQKPVTPDTLFEIASITKVFTGTELALLVQKGLMQLNDPVTNYLPSISKNRGDIHRITLLQLATHTSGLPRGPPPLKNNQSYDHESVLRYLQDWKPTHSIGTRYLYSNLAFGVLGYALEDVREMPYGNLIKQDIALPLGMTSTVVNVPYDMAGRYAQGYTEEGNPSQKWSINAWEGGGALRSTAHDLLLFLEANLGIRGPPELLSAMQLAQKGYVTVNNRLTLGLGWQRVNRKGTLIIDKDGGLLGYASYIGMLPDKKIGIVLLSNKARIKVTQMGRLILSRISEDYDANRTVR